MKTNNCMTCAHFTRLRHPIPERGMLCVECTKRAGVERDSRWPFKRTTCKQFQPHPVGEDNNQNQIPAGRDGSPAKQHP